MEFVSLAPGAAEIVPEEVLILGQIPGVHQLLLKQRVHQEDHRLSRLRENG